MKVSLSVIAAVLGAILPAGAQQVRHEKVQNVIIERQTAGSPERTVVALPPIRSAHVELLSNEFGVSGEIVKNAPYSAEAVSETVQVLADGNRIAHKSSTTVARDSEGRTRRDITLPAPAGQATPNFTSIFDPVADVSYTLDHQAKVARKMPGRAVVMRLERRSEEPAAGVRVPDQDHIVEAHVAGPALLRHSEAPNAKTESLGKQTIEGVVAEGTRSTTTIPAGEIGNDRPINIVTERWYSPELQMIVLSKHSDPRNGETTYRLSNLRRGEPLKSLFEVPADYTVKAEAAPIRQLRMKTNE